MLVGSYHGNPGRLGFLRIEEDEWVFKPPTILLKSVQLLRETHHTPPASVRRLYVMPSTERDFPRAKKLAEVLDTTLLAQNHSPAATTGTAILEVDIYQKSTLVFLSSDKTRYVGPSMRVKKFLNKGMGDMKRW